MTHLLAFALISFLVIAIPGPSMLFTVGRAFTLAGAAYLVFLGIQAIRHRRRMTVTLAAGQVSVRLGKVMADGFVVGLTNPKTIVFFLAVLPQVVDPAGGHAVLQMLALGSIVPAIALVSDSAWALAAGTARNWFAQSPRRLAAIGGTGGLAMVSVGVALATTGAQGLTGATQRMAWPR